MEITVYLPDEIGRRATEEGLNLSRMLRDAVETALNHRDAMETVLQGQQTYLLDAETYTGRIVGTKIAEDGDLAVFVTEDERIVIHNAGRLQIHEVKAGHLREWLSEAAYIEAMHALGIRPVRDL